MSLLSILALVAVVATQYVLYRTPFGLRLRAVGENPAAADAAGVRVLRIRYAAVILVGALAAVGGAYLSIGQSSLFTRNMTAGRGFIALAALIFGKWRPVQTMLACLLFGFADALTIQMQGVAKLPSGEELPVQFVQMIPYVVTIVVLAGFIGHSRAPARSAFRTRRNDERRNCRGMADRTRAARGDSRRAVRDRCRETGDRARLRARRFCRHAATTPWRYRTRTCRTGRRRGVVGHAGRLVVGDVGGRRVAALAGRAHFYEGHDLADGRRSRRGSWAGSASSGSS